MIKGTILPLHYLSAPMMLQLLQIKSRFAGNYSTVVLNCNVERTKLTAYHMAACEVSEWNSKPA